MTEESAKDLKRQDKLMRAQKIVFEWLEEERERQDEQWGQDFTDQSWEQWLTILVEEVGEVAEAILEGREADIRKELIQVAAVAVKTLVFTHDHDPSESESGRVVSDSEFLKQYEIRQLEERMADFKKDMDLVKRSIEELRDECEVLEKARQEQVRYASELFGEARKQQDRAERLSRARTVTPEMVEDALRRADRYAAAGELYSYAANRLTLMLGAADGTPGRAEQDTFSSKPARPKSQAKSTFIEHAARAAYDAHCFPAVQQKINVTEWSDLPDGVRSYWIKLAESILSVLTLDQRVRAEVRLEGGVGLIAQERQRQVDEEGWSTEHDDGHDDGSIAQAALCYIDGYLFRLKNGNEPGYLPARWPWEKSSWSPKNPKRDLVRAGALIAAELDRIERKERKDSE